MASAARFVGNVFGSEASAVVADDVLRLRKGRLHSREMRGIDCAI
jgi:hypothetical protein